MAFRTGRYEPNDKMIDRKVILDNVIKALPEGHDLVPLPKLNVPTPAGMGFQKVYFGARCDCGTSAVLSVEVANDRTESDLESAMPAILDRLMKQKASFRNMSCRSHESLRSGQFK